MNNRLKAINIMRYLIVFLVSILLFIPQLCIPQGISLQNIILNSQDNLLIINISLEFVNQKKIKNLVSKSGLHIIFSGKVEIDEKNNWIWDKKIYSKELRYLIKFNPITNEFILVNLNDSKKIKYKSMKKLLQRLKNISLKIPLWNEPKTTKEYCLKVKFSMKRQIPYWLQKTLFFWNWEIAPTIKYVIDFKY